MEVVTYPKEKGDFLPQTLVPPFIILFTSEGSLVAKRGREYSVLETPSWRECIQLAWFLCYVPTGFSLFMFVFQWSGTKWSQCSGTLPCFHCHVCDGHHVFPTQGQCGGRNVRPVHPPNYNKYLFCFLSLHSIRPHVDFGFFVSGFGPLHQTFITFTLWLPLQVAALAVYPVFRVSGGWLCYWTVGCDHCSPTPGLGCCPRQRWGSGWPIGSASCRRIQCLSPLCCCVVHCELWPPTYSCLDPGSRAGLLDTLFRCTTVGVITHPFLCINSSVSH